MPRTKEKEILIMESPSQSATQSNQKVTKQMDFIRLGNQTDMLVNASAITRFLADLAPAMIPAHGDAGLSEDGCYGLCLILEALNNTITEALVLVGSKPQSPSPL
jgi:hypothetical protein